VPVLTTATTLSRTVLRAEFGLVIRPVQAAEDWLLGRLPDEDVRRLSAERALGRFDAFVGRVLADEGLARRGKTLLAHADAVGRARTLESRAQEQRAEAETAHRDGVDEVAGRRAAAAREHADEVSAAQQEAAKEARAADKAAHARGEAEAKAAAGQAATAARAASARREAKAAQAQQLAAVAAAPARAELAEAAAQARTAKEQQAEADRLAALAAREKESRRA